ncbi:hypothetical protein M0813_10266 [Anaeramoeba flamelloides]|uniref:Uncharacterized protein n=1 Tax=Anaeramoeba flamelloides TaxID=1746091 RepID=A0ABQ8X3A4_9EUKA|nr:hypothetical protein M0813_10266 [Anaeramoeba flamelloides]
MIAIPTRKRIFVPISETDKFNKNEFIPNKTPRNLSIVNKVIGNKPTRINHPSLRQIEQRKKNKENENLDSNLFSMKENLDTTNHRHQQYQPNQTKFSKYLDRNESKLHQQNQRLLNNHFYPTYHTKNMKKEPLYTALEVKAILAKVYKEFTKEKQKQYQDLLNQRYSEQLRIFTITNQQTTGEQKINSASYIN